jgi:hypothetical protein
LQVKGHAPFRGIEVEVLKGAVGPRLIPRERLRAPDPIAAGRLNADDVRPEVGEQLGAIERERLAEVEDP